MTALARHHPQQLLLPRQYRPGELLIAGFVALSVPLWSVFGLLLAKTDKDRLFANAPLIVPGGHMSIKIRPVVDMDSPLLKLGGKKVKARLPKRWRKPEPDQKVVKRKAHVSTKAKASASAPPGDLEISDAGAPPDPDAEVVADTDVEDDQVPDASTEGVGGGSPSGSKHGTETDPLKARAASKYHGRILGFLKRGFRCPSIAEGEKRCSPTASVTISGDGTVTGASFNACGNAKIDTAASTAIHGKVGQQIPPPPALYPELRPNSFSVAYVCK